MTSKYETLSSLGCFRTRDGRIEAICWTHRREGWSVNDSKTGIHHYAPNKREAVRLVNRLQKTT